MKGFMIDMMSAMMPFMKPLVWLAAAAFIVGLILTLAGSGKTAGLSRAALWVVAAIGAFFLLAQGLGALLGAAPSINFGDASKFQFILVPFWQLGLASVAGAAILWVLLRRKKDPAA